MNTDENSAVIRVDPGSAVVSKFKIAWSDQQHELALQAGFREACLHVSRRTHQEGFMQLGDFFRHADDARASQCRHDFLNGFVDPVAAFEKRERVIEVPIFFEKCDPRRAFWREKSHI